MTTQDDLTALQNALISVATLKNQIANAIPPNDLVLPNLVAQLGNAIGQATASLNQANTDYSSEIGGYRTAIANAQTQFADSQDKLTAMTASATACQNLVGSLTQQLAVATGKSPVTPPGPLVPPTSTTTTTTPTSPAPSTPAPGFSNGATAAIALTTAAIGFAAGRSMKKTPRMRR